MLFGDFPPETIEHILTNLSPLDMLSKYILSVIDASVELQIQIELAKDGLKLNYDAVQMHKQHASQASTLIDHIKARRAIYDTPKLRVERLLDCPSTGIYAFDICDGVWGRARERIGDVFYQLRYEFLIPNSEGAAKEPRVHDLDVPVVDFIFWVAGDLQILLEERDHGETRRLHFRTFSTNSPHPLAKVPFIDIHHADCKSWGTYILLLYGDRVGLMLKGVGRLDLSNAGYVLVWDWVTGEMVLPLTYALDAGFISRDYIVRLVEADYELSLALTPLNPGEKTCLFALHTHKGFSSARFIQRTGYNTNSDIDDIPSNTSIREYLPLFTPDPDLDILVLEYIHRGGAQLLVICIGHLLNMYQLPSNKPASAIHMYVSVFEGIKWEWEEWSPLKTWWLPVEMEKASRRAVFGSRLLVTAAPSDLISPKNDDTGPAEDNSTEPGPRLILLDFNSRLLATMVGNDKKEEINGDALKEEIYRWSKKHPDAHHLESTSNFRAILIQDPYEYLTAYLDANGFIGRMVCDSQFNTRPSRLITHSTEPNRAAKPLRRLLFLTGAFNLTIA